MAPPVLAMAALAAVPFPRAGGQQAGTLCLDPVWIRGGGTPDGPNDIRGKQGLGVSVEVEQTQLKTQDPPCHSGVFRDGRVQLDHPVAWPDGARVVVQILSNGHDLPLYHHAVIAGFGPAGRCAADLLSKYAIPFVVVDRNPKTAITQQELGKRVILGDVTEPAVLEQADIRSAGLLIVTIPDEKATIRAIRTAKVMNPSLVILARTEYISTSLVARRAGANAVISAEIAVAKEFHELLLLSLAGNPSAKSDNQ